MKNKTHTKMQKPASTSGFEPKGNKNKSSKSSASILQNTNEKTEKGLAPQQSVEEMKFSVLVENVSPSTEVRSLLFHFRRFDPSASCTPMKQGSQGTTALVGFSSEEKMEKVLSVTHAVDCRLLKLTCEKRQTTTKRPLEATSKDEQPSKKMCLISPQGHKVCVEGLGTKTSRETVAEYFKRFGKVLEATVTVPGKGAGKKKVAFVSLAKENSAKAAASKKKHEIDGVGVTVRRVEGSEALEREDVNGARSSSADSEDEGDEEESDDDEEESGEEEEEESSDDDVVKIQPHQRVKIEATSEDSDDEEEEEDDDDKDDDDSDDESDE